MNSATIMIQAISHDIAMFFCALFTGGAVYISLVEDPASAKAGPKMAGAYLMTAHPRPAIILTIFATVAAIAGLLAGVASGSAWWLSGGAILAFAAFVQVLKVIPLVRSIADAGPDVEAGWLTRRLEKLARLHAVLSLAGLAVMFVFVMKS